MLKTRQFVRKALGENFKPLTGPLLVIMHFRLPVRRSIPNIRRVPIHQFPHILRPDGDNLEKYLSDAMNGLLWADDSQITWLIRSKTMVNAKVGNTTLYVQEIAYDLPDYMSIITQIREHISIDEDIV